MAAFKPEKMRLRLFLILVLLVVASCASTRGVFHTVKKGETLWRICYTYGADIQDVAEVNNIRNPAKIRLGQRVFIPGATHVKRVPSAGSKAYAKRKTPVRKKVVVEKGRFAWPVRGKVVGNFGVKNGTSNNGIDISARRGAPVRASDSGEVVHTEREARYFGNIILLKHRGGFYTLYAHNEENLVKRGDSVKRGETIARVGSSGDAKTSMLHFEIRDGKKVRNPLFFLP